MTPCKPNRETSTNPRPNSPFKSPSPQTRTNRVRERDRVCEGDSESESTSGKTQHRDKTCQYRLHTPKPRILKPLRHPQSLVQLGQVDGPGASQKLGSSFLRATGNARGFWGLLGSGVDDIKKGLQATQHPSPPLLSLPGLRRRHVVPLLGSKSAFAKSRVCTTFDMGFRVLNFGSWVSS